MRNRSSSLVTVVAPFTGTVVELAGDIRYGSKVVANQRICAIERMKLVCPVFSPCAGTVVETRVSAGDRVLEGEELVVIRRRHGLD